jgi:hypothetical protein
MDVIRGRHGPHTAVVLRVSLGDRFAGAVGRLVHMPQKTDIHRFDCGHPAETHLAPRRQNPDHRPQVFFPWIEISHYSLLDRTKTTPSKGGMVTTK